MSNILITFNCIIYLSIIKYYINVGYVLILEVHGVTYTIYIYIYIYIYLYIIYNIPNYIMMILYPILYNYNIFN